MEFRDLVYARKSVRKFKDMPVPDEDIKIIVDALRMGPSAKNTQNWHVLAIKNDELKESLGLLITEHTEAFTEKLAKVDEKKASWFKNFIKNFVFFSVKAPVLLMIYSHPIVPTGYVEHKMIETPEDVLNDLFIQNGGMQSLGAAIQNATLMAANLGYGTTVMTGHSWMRYEIENFVKEKLGFEREGWFLGAMLPIGVPEGKPKGPGRKPLEEILEIID